MILPLTEEQSRQAQQPAAGPVRLRDPGTNQEYVLLRAEVYERLKALLADEGMDPSQAYPAADEVLREDWDDPRMADYDRYEEHRR